MLVSLRAGDSERDLARAGLMGREKLAGVRAIAARQGWLAPGSELPDDAAIAAAMAAAPRVASSSVSSAEPWRDLVAQWLDAGVQGMAIHAALRRLHGYTCSYCPRYTA